MSSSMTAKHETGLSAVLARAETALVFLAGVSLAIIMVVVVLDVTMRYAVSRPLGWSYDLIGSYLMVCVFFFALSDTLHHHGHIAIDIFANALPRRFLHGSLAVGYALGTALLAMIAWQAWIRTTGAWNASNLISATVPWPTWPSYFMVVIGAVLVTLRCGLRALSHAASAVTGRELADMPPPPLTTSSESEHGV
ncbi:TRAP-type C4-dicarboxylate transport system, small permease component [Paracoccus solventivorans]|uniref:TRAP transporter small permease protein n=1 Tax=Paracoccus solventivorans TaxID=53463 RepID=A0A1M7ESB2_9RHOB|nr:TRAP transporter small permease subunit [Paracoccus solventivorans]SHL94476.1 TRAP-type C4-dicarboxylate transport system, small permease component [Paracoccus solventivorans]